MITQMGFVAFSFSCGVLAVAVLGAMAGVWLSWLRRPALRLIAVFGVFAVASGYLWIDAGPKADYRLQATQEPRLHLAPVREYDI